MDMNSICASIEVQCNSRVGTFEAKAEQMKRATQLVLAPGTANKDESLIGTLKSQWLGGCSREMGKRRPLECGQPVGIGIGIAVRVIGVGPVGALTTEVFNIGRLIIDHDHFPFLMA